MAASATVAARVAATITSALDLVTAAAPLVKNVEQTFTNGTGANQINQVWSDTRTLTASATENLDLSGALTNAFGASVALTKVKFILVKAAAANTNDVQVGGAATNGFDSFIGTAGDFVKVKPGGTLMLIAPDATGYAVTAATGDLLKMTNGAGSTSVTYDVVIGGVE